MASMDSSLWTILKSIRTQRQGASKANKHTRICILYWDKADDILSSLGLPNDKKRVTYDIVKTKLKGHVVKQKTLSMNGWAKKTRRGWKRRLIHHLPTLFSGQCGYDGLKNEIIRGLIVVGLIDANLSIKLKVVSDLI